MKIVIFFHFDCFPDQYTNSEVNTCIANVLQRAPNRKGGAGRKEANPSIIAMDEKRKDVGEEGDRIYRENGRSECLIMINDRLKTTVIISMSLPYHICQLQLTPKMTHKCSNSLF